MENKTQNIAGQVFTFDASGDNAMKKYLIKIEKSLTNNPDKFEIFEDFKARIAEKLHNKNMSTVSAADIADLKSEMGSFEEYDVLVKPTNNGLIANATKQTKLLIVVVLAMLILLLGSCYMITASASNNFASNNPMSWFTDTADEMKNWFFRQADEMTSWFYKKSDEMDKRYQEKSDNMTKEYYQTRDKMLQYYQDKSDNMDKQFQLDTERMRQDYENNVKNLK